MMPALRSRLALASTYRNSGVRAAHEAFLRRFDEVHTCAQFVGFPRSGGTLLGALLDSHRDALIAHEADLLRYARFPFRRSHLLAILDEAHTRFLDRGCEWEGYSYAIDGGYQETVGRVKVVGDKMPARASARLRQAPELLSNLERRLGLRVATIILTRNPFDNIATIQSRAGISLAEATTFYARLCEGVSVAIDTAASQDLLIVRLEDLISDCRRELTRCLSHLELAADDDYFNRAESLVYSSPQRSRRRIQWDRYTLSWIDSIVEQHKWLHGYSFDS